METPGETPNISVVFKEKSNGYSSQSIVENDLILHIKLLEVLVDFWLFLGGFFNVVEHVLVKSINRL